MRTNIEIDEEMMSQLLAATGLRTKKDLVALAMRELQRKLAREDIRSLRGKVEFWPGYDPEEGEEEPSWSLSDDSDNP